jgi:recombinase-like protein
MNEYEDRLGDALETLLERGADSLDDLAAGLGEVGVTPPFGGAWSAENLAAELARLGR